MPSSAGGTWPRLRPGPWPNSKPPCLRGPQQFCFMLSLVLARRCTLPTESQPPTASELGAMGPHRRAIVALFGSHISCFPGLTSSTDPPARSVIQPALFFPKEVRQVSCMPHTMHLLSFRDYWAFSSWSQLPLSNWQLVPTGNPIRAEVNGHFISHSTELQNWWV